VLLRSMHKSRAPADALRYYWRWCLVLYYFMAKPECVYGLIDSCHPNHRDRQTYQGLYPKSRNKCTGFGHNKG
jgi:hypothetical protein